MYDNKNNLPLVSIIITTKNSEKHIDNCLKSIIKQSYPKNKIELIVIDNYSIDKTKQIAMKYADLILDKGPERSAQRNYGVMYANGEYVFYFDADMILSNNVVKSCVEKAELEKIDALFIPERIPGQNFWVKVRNFERSFYDATPIDCVRCIRLNLFKQVNGFDELLTGPEDWDLDRRIRKKSGKKFGIINEVIYHNEEDFNIFKYVKHKNYYYCGIERYKKKWGNDDPLIKLQLGAYYRLFGVFIENNKWKRLLTNPKLTLGMYVLRLLVGLSYIINNAIMDH